MLKAIYRGRFARLRNSACDEPVGHESFHSQLTTERLYRV